MNKLLNETYTMNNGLKIPKIGLGTYKLTNEEECMDVIKTAIKAGYKLIDTAKIYDNHKTIAKALKQCEYKREELFITSKIWNSDHKYEDAKKSIDNILKELDLEYIDLLLIHWPTEYRLECYKAMEEAVDEGKVKSIGISNFQKNHIEELLNNCRIKPVVNQFELHPALKNLEVVETCKNNDILVESWGTMIRGKCFDIEQIKELAKKYNKSEAQVCLRWAYQLNYIVIPKTSKPSRVLDNINISDFKLTNDDMELLNKIEQFRDGPDPDNFNF
ncbi:aldo/keto reductase [Spiroplasma turonicum]|uniref:Aldo/keto reductase n=1 Tax=Spiroplasma turonicum TaxID=216946 RepID=A0A0K1P713_9MOLU|nr:aldo/keto reductase [Spiroplasma turonicum]AKU79677.1 aldo/keto reductase [Spiroplasma turonicum]ALX70697.1 aldo/keto reductase [Spiroplasma turonicum]